MVICVVLFFFKQKTAYEMRISDWSSDVCSSDLTRGGPGGSRLFPAHPGDLRPPRGSPHPRRGDVRHGPDRHAARLRTGGCDGRSDRGRQGPGRRLPADRRGPDRKSVVEGKSVSVRVDLGGRRSIKKKTTKTTE